MSNSKPTILIVEDEVLIANDIQDHLLRLGYQVAGIAYNSDKALDMMNIREWELAIIDINLGGSRDGIQLAELINEKYQLPFIYLTSYSDETTLTRAQKTLPYGYIVKPFEPRNLEATIAMATYKFNNEKKTALATLDQINKKYDVQISEREYELIKLILQGKKISEAAETLYVSENTIKTHLKRIYAKLEVNNRVDFTKKILEAV